MKPYALTITKVTQIYGLSRSRQYRLFSSGAITPIKDGARTLILASEVEEYLSNLPRMSATEL